MDGRRLGICLAVVQKEQIAGLLVATSHQSPLGRMPISSRMGSAATLDMTDGRPLDATPARAQLNTRVGWEAEPEDASERTDEMLSDAAGRVSAPSPCTVAMVFVANSIFKEGR